MTHPTVSPETGEGVSDATLQAMLAERSTTRCGFKVPYRNPGDPITSTFIEAWSIPEPNSGCWLWLGRVDTDGYGRFLSPNGRHVRAHRASLETTGVDTPPGMVVCHRCDNPACVNPAHLFVGTHQDNVLDCKRKGRLRRPSGAAHHNTRLTAADIMAIRDDRRPQAQLAAAYGVAQQTISKVRRGIRRAAS